MQSNIAEALSLRFPPLAINYTWEPPADAAELHPLCSMLLLARAAKGETVAITKGHAGATARWKDSASGAHALRISRVAANVFCASFPSATRAGSRAAP